MNNKNFFRPVKVLLIIAIILALGLAAFAGATYVRNNPAVLQNLFGKQLQDQDKTETITFGQTQDPSQKIDDNQITGEEADAAKADELPGIVIGGVMEIDAVAGEKVIKNINLRNDAANTGYYYLTYELRLPDGSEDGYETLFKTDLIEPGNVIQNIEISRALEEGEYDAYLFVQPYLISDKTVLNNANMSTKLIVSANTK